jgi:hypothetical protein
MGASEVGTGPLAHARPTTNKIATKLLIAQVRYQT